MDVYLFIKSIKYIITLLTLSFLVMLTGCTATQTPANTNTNAETAEIVNTNETTKVAENTTGHEVIDFIELSQAEIDWLEGLDVNVDNASFEILSDDLAKDSHAVFYKSHQRDENDDLQVNIAVVENADPISFTILSETYPLLSRDSEHVYLGKYQDHLVSINGIDSTSFQLTDDGSTLGEDVEHYVFDSSESNGYLVVRKDEYVELDAMFAKDDKNVYIVSEFSDGYDILENADPNTFQVLQYGYAYDDRAVYAPHILYEGRVMIELDEADQETFRVLTGRMAVDKDHIYSNGQMFDDFKVDVATFIYADVSEFYKDKNFAYIFRANTGIRLEDTDVDSFEPISGYGTEVGIWWKDRNGVYVGILDGINELAGEYGFDYGNVDVDPDTFSDLVSEDCANIRDAEGCEEYDPFYSYKDKHGSYGFSRSKIIPHNKGYIPQQVLE